MDEVRGGVSFWLHPVDSSPAFICVYIHHGYLEQLGYYYFRITALLVGSVTDVSYLMEEDENVKSFLWRLFHARRAAEGRAPE